MLTHLDVRLTDRGLECYTPAGRHAATLVYHATEGAWNGTWDVIVHAPDFASRALLPSAWHFKSVRAAEFYALAAAIEEDMDA